MCIQTRDIVWINGPFKAGKWPDLKIFRRNLKQQLLPGEMVEADNGYQGEPYHARTADKFVFRADDRAKQSVRARQGNCELAAEAVELSQTSLAPQPSTT